MSGRSRRGAGRLHARRYELTPIADLSGGFEDFAPFVPSINDHGSVAFQARLQGGSSGVFIGTGGAVHPALTTVLGPYATICSHPDIDDREGIVCYATLGTGERVVVAAADEVATTIARSAGPLGPTINGDGIAAFRTDDGTKTGVSVTHAGGIAVVAAAGDRFSAFHGLPTINASGSIAFRADLTGGGSAICVAGDGTSVAVAETGSTFESLGQFPVLSDGGEVGIVGRLVAGRSGVFVLWGDEIETVMDTAGAFESFRGVLLAGDGSVLFYGTPHGGELGIFSGPDPSRDRILGLGVHLFGSTVAEFALNPVSINRAGQLAVRVALADARQWVIRADPS